MKIVTTVYPLDDYGSDLLWFECSVCGLLCLVENLDVAHGVSGAHLAVIHGAMSPV